MNYPKLGRTTRFLLATIVFICISPTAFMSPAVLFGQDGPWRPPADSLKGPVLVAAGPLDLRTELTEKNVKIENWPTTIIPPDAVTSLKDIVDMVTVNRLSQGMPIFKNAIQHKDAVTYNPIPQNMKIVAVRVAADDAIGPLLNPGDRVDVVGVFKKRDPKTNRTTTNSRTFLKAVQVYSIGNRTSKSVNSDTSSLVGLLVTQKQSEALVFVQGAGSVKLVLLRGDDLDNDGEVGSLDDIRERVAKEKFEVFEELKDLRARVDDQQQVIQQLQKRLDRLEKDKSSK